MRTFTREEYDKAQDAWRYGRFGARWNKVRQVATDSGIIAPPHGTPDDDVNEPHPSQRSIVYSCLQDNPTALYDIIRHSTSWYQVVSGIFQLELLLTVEAADREAAYVEQKDQERLRDRVPAGLGGYHSEWNPPEHRLRGASYRPELVGNVLGALNLRPRETRTEDEQTG